MRLIDIEDIYKKFSDYLLPPNTFTAVKECELKSLEQLNTMTYLLELEDEIEQLPMVKYAERLCMCLNNIYRSDYRYFIREYCDIYNKNALINGFKDVQDVLDCSKWVITYTNKCIKNMIRDVEHLIKSEYRVPLRERIYEYYDTLEQAINYFKSELSDGKTVYQWMIRKELYMSYKILDEIYELYNLVKPLEVELNFILPNRYSFDFTRLTMGPAIKEMFSVCNDPVLLKDSFTYLLNQKVFQACNITRSMGDFIKSLNKEVKKQIYESADENKYSYLLELCQDLENIKEVRDLRRSRLYTEDPRRSFEYELFADIYFENEFKECIVNFIQKLTPN